MDRLGPLTLGRELDSSGLLATHEARDEAGATFRARSFGAGIQPTPESLQRFEADAALSGRLDQVGLAPVRHCSGQDPIFVATPALCGVTLAQVRSASPEERIEPEVCIGLGLDLATALSAAHAQGLVHAGLAPDNVLIDLEGRPWITDFALARLITSMSADYSHLMRGSIESLAPEQMTAPDQVGPPTDVFGLGLILYRALTGQEPFEASSALGMSIRLSMGKAEPIESRGVELPSPLAQLVMKMLSASIKDRPATQDVVSELTAMVDRTGAWRDTLRRRVAGLMPADAAAQAAAPEPDAAKAPATGAANAAPRATDAGYSSAPPLLERSSGAPSAAPPPAAAPSGASSAGAPPWASGSPAAAAPGPAPSAVGGGGATPPPAVPPAAPPPAAAGAPPWASASPSAPSPSAPSPSAPSPSAPSPYASNPYAPSPYAPSPYASNPSAPQARPAVQPTLREGIPAPDDSELPDFLRDDDDDERPTLVQDSPLVDEDELPDFLRDDTDLDYLEDPGQPTMISTAPSGPPDALAPPDLGAPSGGDGSELVLPKTEILALPEAPGGPAQPPGIGPPPAVGFQPGPQPSEDPSGSQSSSSGLQWLMWVGIGAGALVLLVTTVLLAITLAS